MLCRFVYLMLKNPFKGIFWMRFWGIRGVKCLDYFEESFAIPCKFCLTVSFAEGLSKSRSDLDFWFSLCEILAAQCVSTETLASLSGLRIWLYLSQNFAVLTSRFFLWVESNFLPLIECIKFDHYINSAF